MDLKILKEFRNSFFEEIKKSKVLNDELKEKILKHYYRGYARKTTERGYIKPCRRGVEFNTYSELIKKGLEWRSFNLYGVKTWAEFEELFLIAYACIENLINNISNGYEIKKAISINRKNLKEILTPPIILIENPEKETENINLKQELNEEMILNLNLTS